MGAARIRKLFESARKKTPCIIFIDELDAVGAKRSWGSSSDSERNSAVNQLLSEMDGFSSEDGVVVLAATNAIHALDSALTRPGRFDAKIQVNMPALDERMDILSIHLKQKNNSVDAVTLRTIGVETEGWSGAELAQIVNKAALECLRNKQSVITVDSLIASFNISKTRKMAEFNSMKFKQIM